MAGRRRLIVGNWKMNGSRARLADLDAIEAAARAAPGIAVALCPPATLIAAACGRTAHVTIGAQDCHAGHAGAFTGRLSAAMLAEAGAELVLVGHSECRAAGDTEAALRSKLTVAASHGLDAILCVGESRAEREAGQAEEAVAAQMAGSLPADAMDGLMIAYEPVWAIGSGRLPGGREIAAMLAAIRGTLRDLYGPVRGDAVRILYGGSVTAGDATAILSLPEIGGLLVGGASLSADTFVPILHAAAKLIESVPA